MPGTPGTFNISVVTPAQEVFDLDVAYASIPAHDGQIGVQPRRAPLLVKLGYGPLSLELPDNQGTQTWFVGGGFAQVKDDKLTVLTDEALPVGELDRARSQSELSDALALPATPESQRQQREKSVARARAMASLAG